jgi:glycosyltransferase involved in cell wall biosynthesis
VSSSPPLVSVVVPVFNGERLVGEALESILAQRHRPLEVLVVDDGSTDRSAEVAETFGPLVQCIRQANRGPAAARNRGLEQAAGDVIGFLDADDLWAEDKLPVQLELLAQSPGVEVVQGHAQRMKQVGVHEGRLQFEPFGPPQLAPSLGSALFRRSVFERVGRFDEALKQGEDVDWFFRAKELGAAMLRHPEVTWFYRRHDRNITNDEDVNSRFLLLAVRRSLERRRQPATGTAAPLPRWFEDE